MNNFTTLGDHQHTEHPLGGPSNQHYGYDDLYRLIEARGQFQGNPEDKRNYTLAMAYDGNPQRQGRCRAAGHPRRTPCGYNITRKTQKDIETQLDKVEDGKHLGPHTEIHEETTYNWAYQYTGSHPHAPTKIGRRIYTYDLNGNQLGWTYPHEEHHDGESGNSGGNPSTGSGQGAQNTAKAPATSSGQATSTSSGQAQAATPAAAGTGHVSGPGRHLLWDEENRLLSYEDEEHSTRYTYDDKGERIFKKGREGFTFYLNQYYIVRNDALISKHLFAGQSRIVTRMVEPKDDSSSSGQSSDGQSGSGKGSKSGDDDVHRDKLYYYHSDHLGSTGYTTNRKGRVNEHHEYFPFGETWIEEEGDSKRPMYLFTGKELDQESGLYYFGARYYDPRTSVWQSADPILGKYLPRAGSSDPSKLPGMGGVYNSFNLGLYAYSQHDPLVYLDPDGRETYRAVRDLNSPLAPLGSHGFVAIITDDPSKYGKHADMFKEYANTTGNVPGVEKGKQFFVAMLTGTEKKDGSYLKQGQKGNVNEGDVRAMNELAGGTSIKPDLDLSMNKVNPKEGKSTFDMEMGILDAFTSLNDNKGLQYGAFASGDKRNCFSLQRSLLEKGGADLGGWTGDLFKIDPGTNTRIPDQYFEPAQ